MLVEGDSERVLRNHLKRFLDEQAERTGTPKISFQTKPITFSRARLRGLIRLELADPEVHLIGLIDVFPDFRSATEAKAFLSEAAENHPRFYSHAAQYDVEAWLLPFWGIICRRLGVKRSSPSNNPETVDHERPPSKLLDELYAAATPPRKFIKPVEMNAILDGQDLTVIARACPEFRFLLGTLQKLSGLGAA